MNTNKQSKNGEKVIALSKRVEELEDQLLEADKDIEIYKALLKHYKKLAQGATMSYFEFDRDFETGETIFPILGRLRLKDDSIVRILLTPKGLILAVPARVKETNEIQFIDDDFGLGVLPPK